MNGVVVNGLGALPLGLVQFSLFSFPKIFASNENKNWLNQLFTLRANHERVV